MSIPAIEDDNLEKVDQIGALIGVEEMPRCVAELPCGRRVGA